MKVLVLSNWDSRIPDILIPFVQESSMTWRWGPVIEFIEKNALPWDQTYRPTKDTCAIMRCDCSYLPLGVTVYKSFGRKGTIIFKVVDVDISRPWGILEYDSAEYIQYFDIKPIHPEVNFYCLPE